MNFVITEDKLSLIPSDSPPKCWFMPNSLISWMMMKLKRQKTCRLTFLTVSGIAITDN